MHKPPTTASPRGLKDVECAPHIGVHERCGRLIAVRYGDERGEVENSIDPFTGSFHEPLVPDISRPQLELPVYALVKVVQPAVLGSRIVQTESPDLGASRNKRFREVASYESVSAGDENTSILPVH
jgi:hypothetical protein